MKQGKGRNDIQIGNEEIKLSVLVDYIILYIVNPKETTHTQSLELMNLARLQDTRSLYKRSVVFL